MSELFNLRGFFFRFSAFINPIIIEKTDFEQSTLQNL